MTNSFLIRSEEVPGPYGKYPGSRSVEELINNGVVIIDKPSGPTSHQVTAWIREMLCLKKVGQSGTLDPAVTGVLVVALGNATKVMPALMGLDKEYIALIHLHKDISDMQLKKLLKKFTGKIKQLPPIKSSVKRELREREIYSIKLLDRKGRDVLLRIKCQAGTYIRKLATDMGKDVGGAHLKQLRRTVVGPFKEKEAVTLQDLKDAWEFAKEGKEKQLRKIVMPVEKAVEHVKSIIIKDSAVEAVCNGSPVYSTGVSKVEKGIDEGVLVAILTLKGELVAIGKALSDSKKIAKKKVIAAKTDRVIMKKGSYPKGWKTIKTFPEELK